MLIKTEEYFNEAEQKDYIRNYYGISADHITCTEDRPKTFAPEKVITQLDRLEANVDYLIMLNE
jgi:hypothetical protein